MNLFLDDVRNPPLFDTYGDPIEWTIVRTASECIKIIVTGKVKFLSFDHDLGNDIDGTGYDVAKFIEAGAYREELEPIDYAIHSANPVGANNIDNAMKNAWKIWDS